ncbi:MAG: DUF2953 domain-containing protein [Clostridia bacterium]|nr:DUF2953 domain-containing protein [Clostridia bacterium]
MGFLKVMLWICLIIVGLILLTGLLILTLLSIRVRLGVDYDEDEGTVLKLGYGFLNFDIDKGKKEEKAKELDDGGEEKPSKPSKLKAKLKDKGEDKIRQKLFEHDIKQAEDMALETERLATEQSRIETELKQAEADLKAAEEAQAKGDPFPEVTAESKLSKLRELKNKIDEYDLEGAIHTAKSLKAGFSLDSVTALAQFIGEQTKDTVPKVGKRFAIKNLEVRLTIHGKDAAQTAMKYGAVSAVVYPAMAKLVSTGRVRNYDIDLRPDFIGTKDKVAAYNVISFCPLLVAAPFLSYGAKVLRRTDKFYKDGMKITKPMLKEYEKETEEKLLAQTAAAVAERDAKE